MAIPMSQGSRPPKTVPRSEAAQSPTTAAFTIETNTRVRTMPERTLRARAHR